MRKFKVTVKVFGQYMDFFPLARSKGDAVRKVLKMDIKQAFSHSNGV